MCWFNSFISYNVFVFTVFCVLCEATPPRLLPHGPRDPPPLL